ncbi:delta(12)-acyl-lipid-desaturase-like [Syzygium oleosum]|uniref:delta(12)-acyl-lipid-desaturase-like n=1 Tax=Syzygium oleosum TaxID=219896 RepID=UPI0024BA3D15|nr:delta(12)-acyl-lipid-desaturase-like [Syzygium oleosum]
MRASVKPKPVGVDAADTNVKGMSPLCDRAPSEKPPFTIADLKRAIPPHCFRRSLLLSSAYLLLDLVLILLLAVAASSLIPLLPQVARRLVAWPSYFFLQGCLLVGVWVVAHECGHGAFSEHRLVNDAVGFLLHAALLVPYFSWKYSHRRHHANTGSLEREEVLLPWPKEKVEWYYKRFNNPPGRVFTIVAALLFGWPLYVSMNVSGRPYHRFASHFDPFCEIFSDRERVQVMASDLAVILATYALYEVAVAKGVLWLMCIYGGPLLVVNGFITLISYLNHFHPDIPRYDASEWDWLRGSLTAVDRDYGILNKVFNHITDTHVVHHLFPAMPHYYAVEATRAIKPILGSYYRVDSTPIVKALWREVRECLYVEQEDGGGDGGSKKGVFWFKNKI